MLDPKKVFVKAPKSTKPENEEAKSEIDPPVNNKPATTTTMVKGANGGKSIRTVSTTSIPGTPDTIIKGTPSTTIKGSAGTPAVLPSKGIKGSPEFDKAFGEAKKAGKKVYTYNGKKYTVEMSGTKGKPATPPTPDSVTPGIPDRIIPGTPPKTETKVEEKPIPSVVYKVDAVKGTIGGKKRDGVGGGITTDSQITANKNVADRAVKGQENYNAAIASKYAPDTKNERGLNPAQLAAKNAKAEQRAKDLKGTTTVTLQDIQSGLERKKVAELKEKENQALASD